MEEVRVNKDLGEVLLAELAEESRGPEKATVERLEEALRRGVIPRELLPALGELIERACTSGRLRARHGPHAEMALLRLYRHTPQGEQIGRSLEPLNKGLQGLVGQRIEALTVTCSGPGRYDIAIDTDRCQVRIELTPGGARVKSIELGI